MNPSLLLALLGGTPMLPGVLALICQKHFLETVRNSSEELLVEWQSLPTVCGDNSQNWRCQETLLLIDNGLQENLVLTKGCTLAPDQEARITQHRAGPGLSIYSYTRVCDKDLCNDLSNALPLWDRPASTAPGPVRCPFCLSTEGCLTAAGLPCPAGHDHCYDGVLQMNGDDISTNLRVQGCMPQEGCNLLNGTQEIGPINVTENCDTKAYLTCQRGVMFQSQGNLSREPQEWTAPRIQICGVEEVCQETLLLVDVGPQSLLVGYKGCSDAQEHDSQVVASHGEHLGVLLAAYTHFCTSHGCNQANSSSVLLNSLPPSEWSGSCSGNTEVLCPNSSTSCYSGYISLRHDDLSFTIHIKGCMTQNTRTLLQHTKNIGIFSVTEILKDDTDEYEYEYSEEMPSSQSKAVPACYLIWMMGLWLPFAL
ncbi:PREDICTED: CD177 antigen isoform X2 [Condylura cristata]|uniref:CD177 antigen isoform X2 n=1 Tax=Condylura cristata TaxID=143302 RepID=UPI000642AAF6|nr:PREDICTED: CD177 antigen isoform X2 [Condylura cristata]